jgi:hypothetical protein
VANKYIRHGATYNGDGLTSAVASGSTVTFTIANPGKVNWTGHGLAANALVYFGVTAGGVLPTGITAGNTYYVRNPGTNDFEISDTSGGTSKQLSGTPSGTASCTTTGAWNHIDIFTGTAVNTITGGTQGGGAVAAGDVVYMRSKSEAAADITISATGTTAVYLGSSSATITSPITWVLDGGSVWSSINGTLTLDNTGASSGTAQYHARRFNNFIAENEDKIHCKTVALYSGYFLTVYGCQEIKNWKIDTSAGTSDAQACVGTSATTYDWMRWVNCNFKIGRTYNLNPINTGVSDGIVEMINCSFELLYTPAVDAKPVISHSANFCPLILIGGRIYGTGATTNKVGILQGGYWSRPATIIGLQYPVSMQKTFLSAGYVQIANVDAFATDGIAGAESHRSWGYTTSRKDNNPPYLSAVLPTSGSTPWSWFLHPKGITSTPDGTYGKRPSLITSKLYTDDADTATITLEFLLSQAVTGANAGTVWMEVIYVDNSTGAPVLVSTLDVQKGSLATSTAAWTPTGTNPTWGLYTFDKKKLSLTTPTSIKKDTTIQVVFNYFVKGTGDDEIAFLCPDVQLT